MQNGPQTVDEWFSQWPSVSTHHSPSAIKPSALPAMNSQKSAT